MRERSGHISPRAERRSRARPPTIPSHVPEVPFPAASLVNVHKRLVLGFVSFEVRAHLLPDLGMVIWGAVELVGQGAKEAVAIAERVAGIEAHGLELQGQPTFVGLGIIDDLRERDRSQRPILIRDTDEADERDESGDRARSPRGDVIGQIAPPDGAQHVVTLRCVCWAALKTTDSVLVKLFLVLLRFLPFSPGKVATAQNRTEG